MTKPQIEIKFTNTFLKFVFFSILSEGSRTEFIKKTNAMPYINNSKGNVQKVFVKYKPQQVIVFTTFHGSYCVIEGFKFGLTDLLTGSKNHIKTIENILKEKAPEEMDMWY